MDSSVPDKKDQKKKKKQLENILKKIKEPKRGTSGGKFCSC